MNLGIQTAEEQAESLELIGGALCLDFSNTVGNHSGAQPRDHLISYAALVAWSEHAGILARRGSRRLVAQATLRPLDAERVLEQARELREALYRIFVAVSQRANPAAADLEILNQVLARALPHGRIVPTDMGFAWSWLKPDEALDQMLWPIVRSAAQLLTSEKLRWVRECHSADCGWLFLDLSKNHSRRWCSMTDCGNRAKVRRFYERRRTGTKQATFAAR